jgi:hypothetical protein
MQKHLSDANMSWTPKSKPMGYEKKLPVLIASSSPIFFEASDLSVLTENKTTLNA